MNNIIKRTGYHTCRKEGNLDLSNVPFLSEHNKEKKLYNFLGTGYYVWDGNEDTAHWWGKTHYNGNYIIVKMELNIPEDELLDLVGNPEQMKEFHSLYMYYKKNKYKSLTLAEFIELLKRSGSFTFKIIKAKTDHTKEFFSLNEKNDYICI